MDTQTERKPYKGLTWEGQSVEIADIERELNRLWHATVGAAEDKQLPVRSSVLNLVVYTASDADAEKLSETVGRLSGRHPLRAIILSAEPYHPQPSLDTSINTYCYEEPETQSQSCFQQVIVGANGDAANHLAGVVMPLLVPDLPVYLWWMGEPEYGSEIVAGLARSSKKLILDSRSFAPAPEGFRRAVEHSRSLDQFCAVTDLNWVRLWPWFDAIAQFFDDAALLPHLGGIERVRIEYSGGGDGAPSNPAQAALLAGWLFSRLGERPDAVELVAVQEPGVDAGNVVSYSMRTRHGTETASFEVRQQPGSATHARATARVGDRQVFDRSVVTKRRTHAEMLDIALEGCARDVPYEEAAQIAAELVAGGLVR